MKDIESGESAAGTKQRLIDQNVKIAFVVGFYFVSSMLLVFLNKRMFSVSREFLVNVCVCVCVSCFFFFFPFFL